VAEVPLALEVEIAPTPAVTALAPALEATMVPQGEAWSWLDPECDRAALETLFDQILDLSSTFAWYTLSGQEATRVELPQRAEILHLRLEAREALDRRLRLALHVARDEATLAAWRRGEIGPDQITICEVLREELSSEAYAERLALDRPDAAVFPRVTVGPEGRAPTRSEWQVAARALMAFNALHDPLEGGEEGRQTRLLDHGEVALIEVLEAEYLRFPENDGALTAGDTLEDREDERFVEAYMSGRFDVPERERMMEFP
jgi:predicted nucleic acid-binding protein